MTNEELKKFQMKHINWFDELQSWYDRYEEDDRRSLMKLVPKKDLIKYILYLELCRDQQTFIINKQRDIMEGKEKKNEKANINNN